MDDLLSSVYCICMRKDNTLAAWLFHFLSHSFIVGGYIVTATDPAAQPMKLIFDEFYITGCKHDSRGFFKYTREEMN